MATRILFGEDANFSSDLIVKEGSIPKKFLDRIESEYPNDFWDWDEGDNITLENDEWVIHYNPPFPLCFYHQEEFVFGIRKPRSEVYIDQESPEAVWIRMKTLPGAREDYTNEDDEVYEEGSGRIVVERDDFPRFQTLGRVFVSHTLERTEYENVYSLGNGYVLASSREVEILKDAVRTNQECWWMVAPESEAAEVSRRVLAVKLYDGPYTFQSRSTDIRLSDPTPPTDISEYVIYAYDREGIRGIYREVFQGVAPQKKAFVVEGQNLVDYAEDTDLRFRGEQLVGPGRVRYRFPLYCTKFLNLYWRGSEVGCRIRADNEEWTDVEEYDGKAISHLDVEFEVYSSMSSFRVEYESLKDWVPVGRPVIDIEPNSIEGVLGNSLRITGKEGEGIRQSVDLYTGMWSAGASVNCFYGEAVLDVGGMEIVTWDLNQRERYWGNFVSNNDEYEITITGNGNFSFEVDHPSVTEIGHTAWQGSEMEWSIETEAKNHPATHSINNPETPVSLDEEKLWRVKVHLPSDVEREEVTISDIFATTYSTGEEQITRSVYWKGSGKGRVYYPENVISPPTTEEYIALDGRGATVWQQYDKRSVGDVRLKIDGSPLAFKDQSIYRPVTMENELWRVEIGEDVSEIYFEDEKVGEMYGQGLPFEISKINSEDIQLDCSVGFVQLRRRIGPRFQGWEVGYSAMPTAEQGASIVWGSTHDEAEDNIPFYDVTAE